MKYKGKIKEFKAFRNNKIMNINKSFSKNGTKNRDIVKI